MLNVNIEWINLNVFLCWDWNNHGNMRFTYFKSLAGVEFFVSKHSAWVPDSSGGWYRFWLFVTELLRDLAPRSQTVPGQCPSVTSQLRRNQIARVSICALSSLYFSSAGSRSMPIGEVANMIFNKKINLKKYYFCIINL